MNRCPRLMCRNFVHHGTFSRFCLYLPRRLCAAKSSPQASSLDDKFYLQSLGIKGRIKPVKKSETFVKRAYFGEFDKAYVEFPNLVASKNEEALLTSQFDFIKQNFMQICSHPGKQVDWGLFDVDSMTSFELTYLFEAIGASLSFQPASNGSNLSHKKLIPTDKLSPVDSFVASYQETKTFVQAILPLLVHNSLVMGAVDGSANSSIKERLSLENKLNRPCIAFAFCELSDRFSALPYPFWESIATCNEKGDTWTINGSKRFIYKAGSEYTDYVIFCKVSKEDTLKNASDDDIAVFLVNRDSLKIEQDGMDNYGNQYLKISFKDLVLTREQTLYTPVLQDAASKHEHASTFALNIKARGQLAASAIMFGIVKESTSNIIKAFDQGKLNTSESILKGQMSQITTMLYSMESMLYLTSSQFDSFDLNHADVFLQAMIVKTLVSENCVEIINQIRFMLDARQLPPFMSSQTINVLNVLDSFLDSTTSNRLLVATYGLKNIGAWKFDHIAKIRLKYIYGIHAIKYFAFKRYRKQTEQRFPNSFDDFESLNLLNPKLKKSIDLLKEVMGYETAMGYRLLRLYGKTCLTRQADMNRYASIAMSAFQMISVISRTNLGLEQNMPHSQLQLELCERICKKEARNAKSLKEHMIGFTNNSQELQRSKWIHKRNMQFDGYFAKPTFDRII